MAAWAMTATVTATGGRRRRAAALAIVAGLAAGAAGGAAEAGAGAPSTIELTGPGEAGTRMVVRGRVFEPDGETPAAGVTLYVYQTDAEGYYSRDGGVPRLRGWMTTDAEGRYEYRTIRPGSYPDSRIPAHVHTQLWGAGWPKQWSRDLNFADDPFLPERERRDSAEAGRFAWVCAPARDAGGTLACTHDLRLEETGDSFQPGTAHGAIPKE